MTPKRKPNLPFNPKDFLAKAGAGKSISDFAVGQNVFSQGDTADAIYYILNGKIKLSVVSKTGREAVIVILGPEQMLTYIRPETSTYYEAAVARLVAS